MKRLLITGSIAAAIATASVGCGNKQTKNNIVSAASVPNVNIIKVNRSSVAETYDASGTVIAKTITQVGANLLGRIRVITANEGDTVRKGQLLIGIDDRDAQAQLEKAQAGLKEAQAALIEVDNSAAAATAAVKTAEVSKQFVDVTFARYKELYGRRSVSGQEYDEALSKSNSAASELERAKANVQTIISRKVQLNARIDQAKADIVNAKVSASYSRIYSPVSGVIIKKFVEQGAIASPGVPLLSIEDTSQYRLEVSVSESHSRLVHIGERVTVRIDALRGNEMIGRVAEVLPTADATSRSFTVKIDVPANPLMKSGLYGLARFSLSQKEAIVIPENALVQRGQLNGVYIVGRDGTAHFRIVTTGKTSEGTVEILSGINEDEEIAISDIGQLQDGMKVRQP